MLHYFRNFFNRLHNAIALAFFGGSVKHPFRNTCGHNPGMADTVGNS